MLFDLVTLVLAPVMWIGGYVGYHARRPSRGQRDSGYWWQRSLRQLPARPPS